MGVIVSHFTPDDYDRNISVKQYQQQQSESQKQKFNRPKLNKHLGGPTFTTLDFNNSYATRHYAKTVWASTIEKKTTTVEQVWKCAKPRLQKYFDGRNVCKTRLPHTCPAFLKLSATTTNDFNEHDDTPEDVTLSLPLPKNFTENPPRPQDQKVFLIEEYRRIYYAGYFHKKLMEENIRHNIRTLKSKLIANGEKINGDVCYVAIYETKHKNFAQMDYYEIWFEGLREDQEYICVQNCDDDDDDGDGEENDEW